MATYKQPCVRCGELLERDARFCPKCGSSHPFGSVCPECLRPIEKGQQRCAGCGRPLYTTCPHCGGVTFVDDLCEVCGRTLMVLCSNSRCNCEQFFENRKCTVCGKKLKPPKIKKA